MSFVYFSDNEYDCSEAVALACDSDCLLRQKRVCNRDVSSGRVGQCCPQGAQHSCAGPAVQM